MKYEIYNATTGLVQHEVQIPDNLDVLPDGKRVMMAYAVLYAVIPGLDLSGCDLSILSTPPVKAPVPVECWAVINSDGHIRSTHALRDSAEQYAPSDRIVKLTEVAE